MKATYTVTLTFAEAAFETELGGEALTGTITGTGTATFEYTVQLS